MASLATIFPDVLAIPFGETGDKTRGLVPIDWTLVERIRAEADANHTVIAAFSILSQKVFAGGFTFLYSRAGDESAVDEFFENYVVKVEWMPQLEKLLKHFVYFGFACVTYVRSASGLIVPHVLDTNAYCAFYRSDADGGRRYVVYATPNGGLAPLAATTQPYENARFIVVSEPDSCGRPVSQMHGVLASLVRVSNLWENITRADHERTHPAYVYERAAGANGNGALVPGSEASLDYAINDARLNDERLVREANTTDRAEEEVARRMARFLNSAQRQRVYDKESGDVKTVDIPFPWEKQKNVPNGLKLAAPLVPQVLPFFVDLHNVLSTSIAHGGCGVPIELLGGVRANSQNKSAAATTDTTLAMLRDTTLRWHDRLAPAIATLYMDIFRGAHMEDFEEAMLEAQRVYKVRLTDEEIIAMQRHYYVRVVFNNTPALRFEDIRALREAKVINRETAQRLALGAFNLPADLAMSREEEDEEAQREARAEADAAAAIATATAQAAPNSGAKGGGAKGGGAAKVANPAKRAKTAA